MSDEKKPYLVEWATTEVPARGQWEFHETEEEAREELPRGGRLFRIEWTEVEA